MKCPHCGADTKAPTIETRRHEGATFRRRNCGKCNKNFVTQEVAPAGLKMPAEVRDSRTRGQLDIEKRNESRRVTSPEMKADFSGLNKVW